VSIVAIVLLAAAVLLLVGAEWPRISGRVGSDALERRSREKRKQKLTVIQGHVEPLDDVDDFAASVQRDLESLPVLEERDPRS
jgi:hypothetical protein